METDRELLELAANSAGYVLDSDGDRLDERENCGAPLRWNPLNDDGDALRLAVKLRIDVVHDDPRDNDAWVMAGANMDCVEDVDGESSRGTATRRAIVRAAAAIGEHSNDRQHRSSSTAFA